MKVSADYGMLSREIKALKDINEKNEKDLQSKNAKKGSYDYIPAVKSAGVFVKFGSDSDSILEGDNAEQYI